MASVISDPRLSSSLGVQVIAADPPVTPDDLLRMPDGVSYELVDGKLVERNMGLKSSWIGGRMHHFLSTFSDDKSLGWVVPADASFRCFADAPDKVRKPDVSFIKFGRLPGEEPSAGHCPIAPDLAVFAVTDVESLSSTLEALA